MTKKTTSAKINVKGTEIAVIQREDEDYISLTDIAKSRNADHPDDLIRNWLRNRNTLELLGIWEQLHNRDFNPVEFDGIKKLAGLNSFTLTPKQWIEKIRRRGDCFKTRPLWRHLRPSGCRLRIRIVGIRRVQALPHQGVPTPQGRRKPTD